MITFIPSTNIIDIILAYDTNSKNLLDNLIERIIYEANEKLNHQFCIKTNEKFTNYFLGVINCKICKKEVLIESVPYDERITIIVGHEYNEDLTLRYSYSYSYGEAKKSIDDVVNSTLTLIQSCDDCLIKNIIE